MITLAYITARKEPHFEWFSDSLSATREAFSALIGARLVIVDFYAHERDLLGGIPYALDVKWVKPKPTVWQGQHRLTSVDYFAAANARNTALCLAPDGWIVYVDDLSVLTPEWLAYVLEATKREGIITVGGYEKVFDLQVENGVIKSWTPDPQGVDHRIPISGGVLRHCRGNWLFGSSLVAPVEVFLNINGWDENCDGMGYEDVVTGQVLDNSGCNFVFDPRMRTLESQELHQQPGCMKRIDKGVSPNDKSHAVLASAQGRKWCPNYFGPEGIRGLRQRILNGDNFPIIGIPEHDWYDHQPLREM